MNSNSVYLAYLKQEMGMQRFVEYVRQCYVFNFDFEVENV